MNQNDLGQEISAASQHTAETNKISHDIHPKQAGFKSIKWIMVAGLWLVVFYTLSHFDRELATLVTSANKGEIEDSTALMFDEAASSVETFYEVQGRLPDAIPMDYLSDVLIYSKTDDTHYQLMFTFNGIQTINHYAISYQVD